MTTFMMMMMKCAKIFSSIMMLMLMAIIMVHGQTSSFVAQSSSINPWMPPQPAPLVWVNNRNQQSSLSRVARATISAPIPVAPKPTPTLIASTRPVTAIVPVMAATIVPVVSAFQPQLLAPVSISQPIAMASNSNSNYFTLSSVQRRRHTIRYQAPKGSSKNSTLASPSEAPEEIAKPQTINVPIGISHYKPIQFVDSLQPFQQPTDYKAFIESFNVINKNSTSNNNNNNKVKSDRGQKPTDKRQTDKHSTKPSATSTILSNESESTNDPNEIK
nr:uncharacterized protein LOC124493798 [Dermatophagoides farinae]XP_046912857.1 uncharacterized protein LOC124493798 [Dermatophagoides farinae]